MIIDFYLKQSGGGDMSAVIAGINAKVGDPAGFENVDAAVQAIPYPVIYPVGAVTVEKTAGTTENYAANDLLKIRCSDGHDYTIAERNAAFVENGYSAEGLPTPVGFAVTLNDGSVEVLYFPTYNGVTYNPSGETAGAAGKLQHSLYNHNLVTAAGTGTDSTTNKDWAVTVDGDDLVLSEENTGCSWRIAKDTGNANSYTQHNLHDRVMSLWAQTEWLRHRFAIPSGVSTAKEDGTMGEIAIFDAIGAQAAVGDDMYFWIKNDQDVFVNTSKLAKYNVNNRHGVSGYSLTSAIADAIYAKQKAAGVDMNDTGVNSDTKPVLAPGSKGAECIAVDGEWYIITPYISNPNATTATISNNVADSPAVYWAIHEEVDLPSDTALHCAYLNKSLFNAIVSYLNTVESAGVSGLPTGDYIWTAVRNSAPSCWVVYLTTGVVFNVTSCSRYFVVGASAS